MSLSAVLFDFNSLIIDDEAIAQKALAEIILAENLLYEPKDYRQLYLGRSDRDGLTKILAARDRMVTPDYLTKLIQRKNELYLNYLNQTEDLVIYPNFREFLESLQAKKLRLGIVTGSLLSEITTILAKTGIASYFDIIISGDLIEKSKPDSEGHLLACEKLGLTPSQCLAIETTFVGIEAAKKAKIQVVGLANLYPVHILQRRANWAIDYLADLELDRVFAEQNLLEC